MVASRKRGRAQSGRSAKRRLFAPKRPRRHTFAKAVKAVIAKAARVKTRDFVVTSTVDTLGIFTDLTNIPEGNDLHSRETDTIEITSISWKGLWYDADDTWNFCKTFIANWKDQTTPVIGDFLNTSNNFILPFAHKQLQDDAPESRFGRVLRSGRLHKLATSSTDFTSAANQSELSPKRVPEMITWRPKKPMKVKYDQANVPLGNQPWLVNISDSNAVLHPNITGNVRVTFHDKL